MTYRRYVLALVFVGACAMFVAGCGTSEEPPVTVNQQGSASGQSPAAQPPASEPPASAPATPPSAESAPSADSSLPAASGTAGAAATQPIAVEDHEVSGVQVALMDIRRTSGDTVTVRMQFRNTTDKDVSDSLFYTTNIVDKMYLIDGGSKKKYMVVRDADDKAVGYAGQSSTIAAKGTAQVWARFPAPASPKVMLSVPGVPPFEDVPIN